MAMTDRGYFAHISRRARRNRLAMMKARRRDHEAQRENFRGPVGLRDGWVWWLIKPRDPLVGVLLTEYQYNEDTITRVKNRQNDIMAVLREYESTIKVIDRARGGER